MGSPLTTQRPHTTSRTVCMLMTYAQQFCYRVNPSDYVNPSQRVLIISIVRAQRHGWENDENNDEEDNDEEISHDGDFVEHELSERGGADADRQQDERDEHDEIGDDMQSLTS